MTLIRHHDDFELTIPDTSAHAAAWLRLCPSQRRPRHTGTASLAGAQEHSTHGALHRAVAASVQGLLALIVGDRGIDHDPRGRGFEVMGPAGGNGLGQYLRYVDFCVANSTGSTMDGSSFSGLLTRVDLNSDVPAIDLA